MRAIVILSILAMFLPFRLMAQTLGNCDSAYQFQMFLSETGLSMQLIDLDVANDSTLILVGYRGSGTGQNGFISSVNTNGTVNWARHSGGDEEDGYYCIGRDKLGSMYVGGYTWSATSGRAAIVAKYLPNGNLAWRKIYGFGREYIYRVKISSNRQFVYFTGLSIDNGFGSEDFTVYKLDTNGNLQWAKQCGDGDLNRSHNLIEAGDSRNLYVVGTGGNPYPILRGNIVKLDSNGSLIWSKKYEMPTDYQVAFYDVQNWGNDLLVYGYLGLNNGSSTSVNKEILLARIALDGNVKWAKKYTLNYAIPWQMQILGDRILLAGGDAKNGGDGFLIITDSNGNLQHAKQLGNSDKEFIFGLRATQKSEVYFAGYKGSPSSVAWFGKAGCKLNLLCDVTEALPVAQDITFNVSNVDWQIQDFYSPVNFALQETNFSPQLSTICKTGDTTPLNPCEGDSFRGAKAECICPIYIPNAFTPGRSQNLNDKLKIVYTCPFNSAVVRVYNRWGQKIFESADSGMLWDGQYQGKLVPTGAYYCTVSIKGMYKGLFQEFIKSGVVYVVE